MQTSSEPTGSGASGMNAIMSGMTVPKNDAIEIASTFEGLLIDDLREDSEAKALAVVELVQSHL